MKKPEDLHIIQLRYAAFILFPELKNISKMRREKIITLLKSVDFREVKKIIEGTLWSVLNKLLDRIYEAVMRLNSLVVAIGIVAGILLPLASHLIDDLPYPARNLLIFLVVLLAISWGLLRCFKKRLFKRAFFVFSFVLFFAIPGFPLWNGIIVNKKNSDMYSLYTVKTTVQAASLGDLKKIFADNREYLERAAARAELTRLLNDTGISWQKRGNAAIVLALLNDFSKFNFAFGYEGDPSASSWLIGAAREWLNEKSCKSLFECMESEYSNLQTKKGAIASLGVAKAANSTGVTTDDDYLKKASNEIADRLRKYSQNESVIESIRTSPGFASTLSWTMRRFDIEETPRKQAFSKKTGNKKWYKSVGDLCFINLPEIKMDNPYGVEKALPFYMSDTEVTIRAFKNFVTSRKYKTTAENSGKSWSLNGEYKWREISGANWNKPLIAGMDYRDRIAEKSRDSLPVTNISWLDAIHFCNWLTEQDESAFKLTKYYRIEEDKVIIDPKSNGYRLPTVLEWHCAAQADTRTKFWWGRFEYLKIPDWRKDPLWQGMVANLPDKSNVSILGIADTIATNDGFPFSSPVATFRPNPMGFFDIIGNVGEWCDDPVVEKKVADAGKADGDSSDKTEAKKAEIVLKLDGNLGRAVVGGSWGDRVLHCSPYFRGQRRDNALSCHINVGFRVARHSR